MYVWKLLKDQKRRDQEREFQMELTGQFMALFANANRDEKKRLIPFSRQDFFKLSYDINIVEERPMTLKEAKQLLGSRFKRDGK
jgi:DNA-directed RNA polymerase subunit F